MEKPKTLYRGIRLNYMDFRNFDLVNQDLVVPYEPIIDNEGRKVVTDGNEYGVYMSDNPQMVYDVYGNVHNGGTLIDKTLLPSCGFSISIPDVGIVYEIDTNGLDVRRPFIKRELNGVFNNGYIGLEWIADRVPSSNYKVTRIRIGADYLHDYQDVPIINGDVLSAQKEVNKIINIRIERLDNLVKYIKGLPITTLRRMNSIDKERLVYIYGENGAFYSDIDNINVENSNDLLRYLFTSFYNQDSNNTIPLDYIIQLSHMTYDKEESDKPKAMIDIIVDDLSAAKRRRENALKNNKPTLGFDKKIDMLHSLLETMKKALSLENIVVKEG